MSANGPGGKKKDEKRNKFMDNLTGCLEGVRKKKNIYCLEA